MANTHTPPFSWSGKREALFHSCELCYIMHYYISHKGGQPQALPEKQAAYRWKKAHTIESLLLQTLTEALIERVYNGGPKLSVLRQNVLSTLNKAFNQSIHGKEQWYENPSKHEMLYELVYQDHLDDALVKRATNQLDTCLQNFKRSQLVKEVATGTCTLKPVRQGFEKGYAYHDFLTLGLRAYSRVQIVHEREDRKVIATLFQTTNRPSSLSQIRAVAETVAEQLDIPITSIIVRDEFLLTGTYEDHQMTKELVKLTTLAIRESVDKMSRFLINKDVKRNEFAGFSLVSFERATHHKKAEKANVAMSECPYCEAVRRDLELYPNGYDPKIKVLKYKGQSA